MDSCQYNLHEYCALRADMVEVLGPAFIVTVASQPLLMHKNLVVQLFNFERIVLFFEN